MCDYSTNSLQFGSKIISAFCFCAIGVYGEGLGDTENRL